MTVGAVLLSILFALPNVLPQQTVESIQKVVPWAKTVNLGLDLQGGSHILLQIDLQEVTKQRADDILASLRPVLREQRIGYRKLEAEVGGVAITLRDAEDEAAIRKAILPRLFSLTGLDLARSITDQVVEVTRVGLSRDAA